MKYCGRVFSDNEIEFIRNLALYPDISRRELSRRFCQEFGWLKPDGSHILGSQNFTRCSVTLFCTLRRRASSFIWLWCCSMEGCSQGQVYWLAV